jgi:Uncharacterized protein encoded in hypervariable junctions of pilus gene clusters
MNYLGYTGTVTYSPVDKVYHGRIENVSDHLVTYEGDTKEECEYAFQQAVEDYIELLKKLNENNK